MVRLRENVLIVGVAGIFLFSFGAAAWFAMSRGEEGQADSLPGVVDQSSSAEDSGFVVEALRAEFSSTALDVVLKVTPKEDGVVPGGIRPGDATLDGTVAQSAYVQGGGMVLLRFPGSAWAEGATALDLSITAVQEFAETGGFPLVEGRWDLAIQPPAGAKADAARSVRALEPATVDIAGHPLVVTALTTQSATIVRYQLPPGVESGFPPKLVTGDTMMEPQSVEELAGSGLTEVWYEATGDGSLLLNFEDLLVEDPDEGWSATIRLDTFEPPAPASEYRVDDIGWELVASSDAPELLAVEWENSGNTPQDYQRLIIAFDDSWIPAMETPSVTGDGEPLRVVTHGTINNEEGVRRSFIGMELGPGDEFPQELTVEVAGSLRPLPPVEVVFEP